MRRASGAPDDDGHRLAGKKEVIEAGAELEIAGEAVAVQGSVHRAQVLAKGYSTVQGALAGPARVEAGGYLLVQGAVAGDVTIAKGGLCVLQGAIVGSVHNDGGLVLQPHASTTDLGLMQITGDGRVLDWEGLPDEMKATLPPVT